MITDIRVPTDFFSHWKTQMVAEELGWEAIVCLQRLWVYLAQRRPDDGALDGLSNRKIALASGWRGDPDAYVTSLAEAGFLDGEPGAYLAHAWPEHQPFVAGSRAREDAARKAGQASAAARRSSNGGPTEGRRSVNASPTTRSTEGQRPVDDPLNGKPTEGQRMDDGGTTAGQPQTKPTLPKPNQTNPTHPVLGGAGDFYSADEPPDEATEAGITADGTAGPSHAPASQEPGGEGRAKSVADEEKAQAKLAQEEGWARRALPADLAEALIGACARATANTTKPTANMAQKLTDMRLLAGTVTAPAFEYAIRETLKAERRNPVSFCRTVATNYLSRLSEKAGDSTDPAARYEKGFFERPEDNERNQRRLEDPDWFGKEGE